MKIIIIYLLLAFNSWALAQSSLFNQKVSVSKEGDQIFLIGKECELLNKEGEALNRWTKSIKEESQKSSCSCRHGVCRKEVTSAIPDFVEAYQFKHVATDGPNCWNATLVAAKVVPQVRYTSDFEMNFWMNSPLCKERKEGEPLEPGDIIAIRSAEHKEVHGFVHLSDNLSFSKNGFDKSVPYSLQDPNVVFDLYKVPKNCRRKTGFVKGCSNYANYFRCQSMDDYLKENPIRDSIARQSFSQLEGIECSMSEAVLSGESNPELKKLMLTTVEIISVLAYDTIMNNKFDPDDKVVWQALYHKSRSLKDQLSVMKE